MTLLVAAIGSLGLSTPVIAETVIAQESGWSTVSAHGGRLAWSSYRPETKDYVLKTRFGGVISELPVAPRGLTFDVDLGPDPRGRTVAVYSRCAVDESISGRPPVIPSYHSSSGCDIYRYDFETGVESRIKLTGSARREEFLPSVWGDRIAFAGNADRAPIRVYTVRLSDPRPRALKLDPSGWDHPDKVDLRGRRVAYSAESSCYPPDPEGARDAGPLTEIRLGTVDGRRQRRVDRGCVWREKTDVSAPALTSRALYYVVGRRARSGLFPANGFFARFSFQKRQIGESREPVHVRSLSLDGGALYYTRAYPEGDRPGSFATEVVQSDPISYRPRR